MKGYSAIQCGTIFGGFGTILDLASASGNSYIIANNPIKLQSVTLTMTTDIAAGETAEVTINRNNVANGTIVVATLDETCKQYDSIVFDLQDYENSGGDCGDLYSAKTTTAATTAASCIVTFNYILIESGEPVWNSGSGIKQKRNRVAGDTSVIRDATPYYTRAS